MLLLAHKVGFGLPIKAVTGTGSTVIVTLETEVQVPFVMVHSNTLSPTPKEFTSVLGELTETIVPEPTSRDQEPVPRVGTFAAK